MTNFQPSNNPPSVPFSLCIHSVHTSHGPHSWIQVFPPLVLALDAGELPKKFSVTSASTQKIAEVIKNLALLWRCLGWIGSYLAAGVLPIGQMMWFFDMLLVKCMALHEKNLVEIRGLWFSASIYCGLKTGRGWRFFVWRLRSLKIFLGVLQHQGQLLVAGRSGSQMYFCFRAMANVYTVSNRFNN